MRNVPSTDQFDWSPFQVFQYQLTPEAGKIRVTKTYKKIGGRNGKDEPGEAKTYTYERKRLIGHKERNEAFGSIYGSFKRSTIGAIANRAHTTPDTFTIAIGVTNLRSRHGEIDKDGNDAGSISYTLLFELLDNNGFKPLSILNKNRSKIEKEMETQVNRIIKRGENKALSKQDFFPALNSIANKWTERARDYIAGGDKPRLSDGTITIRHRKAANNSGLYSHGITEPLVESGQLMEAIQNCVFMSQSEQMKLYVSRMSEINKELRRKMKQSKAAVQKNIIQNKKRRDKYAEARREIAEAVAKKRYKNMAAVMLDYFGKKDLTESQMRILEDTISTEFDRYATSIRSNLTEGEVATNTLRDFAYGYKNLAQWYSEFKKRGAKETDIAFPELDGKETVIDFLRRNQADLRRMKKTVRAAREFLMTHGMISKQSRFGLPMDIEEMVTSGIIPGSIFK